MVTTTPHTGYFCESVEYKLTTLALVKGVQAPEDIASLVIWGCATIQAPVYRLHHSTPGSAC